MAIIYLVGSRCKAMDIYDREKLYEEVWNESVTIVARKYGVSDVPTPRVAIGRKLN